MSNDADLDFMSAIEAHVRWKIRLEAYIGGSLGETLDAGTVERDDQCALGKWIHGSGGARHAEHPAFEELKSIHAEFHHNAADVIRLVDAGKREDARKLLNQGAYATCSQRIKSKLARLSLELDEG